MTQNSERIANVSPRRSRGGQPGNQNAQRHGLRSRAAIMAGKFSTARLKALAHVARAHNLVVDLSRHRISRLRPDQIKLLVQLDPHLFALVQSGYLRAVAPPETDGEHD